MWQVADVMVINRLPPAIDHHQAGVCPLPEGLLGNQVPRKLIVKWHSTGGHGLFELKSEEFWA